MRPPASGRPVKGTFGVFYAPRRLVRGPAPPFRRGLLWDTLLSGRVAGLGELAAREGMSGSYATRLVRLAFLTPDLLEAVLDGRQPAGLTAAALLRECRRGLPPDWRAQRALLGSS